MGRKSTQCPKWLRAIIETARKFPLEVEGPEIQKFDDAFTALVFAPGGYHERLTASIMAMGGRSPLEASEKPLRDDLRNVIRTTHLIPRDFVELAIEMGIPPGKEASSELIQGKWDRTSTLRDIAAAPGYGSWVRIRHTAIYKRNLDSTIEELKERPQTSGLIHRIMNEKIPISRIRLCPVCRHVYWANTTRKETCETVCSQKLGNQRRNRNGYL